LGLLGGGIGQGSAVGVVQAGELAVGGFRVLKQRLTRSIGLLCLGFAGGLRPLLAALAGSGRRLLVGR
jgi:hypothetical protein